MRNPVILAILTFCQCPTRPPGLPWHCVALLRPHSGFNNMSNHAQLVPNVVFDGQLAIGVLGLLALIVHQVVSKQLYLSLPLPKVLANSAQTRGRVWSSWRCIVNWKKKDINQPSSVTKNVVIIGSCHFRHFQHVWTHIHDSQQIFIVMLLSRMLKHNVTNKNQQFFAASLSLLSRILITWGASCYCHWPMVCCLSSSYSSLLASSSSCKA